MCAYLSVLEDIEYEQCDCLKCVRSEEVGLLLWTTYSFPLAVADRLMGPSVKKVDPFCLRDYDNKHLQHQSPLAVTA